MSTITVHTVHGPLLVDSLVLEACGFKPGDILTEYQERIVMMTQAHYMIAKCEAEIARRKAAGLPANGG